MAKKPIKPTAYPELIKPGKWTVDPWKPTDPAPCVSQTERRMLVPVGRTNKAQDVRFHELLHVKHSPDTVPDDTGASIESILASEDCRVNCLGSRIRPHDALKWGPKADPFMVATQFTARTMAQLTAASLFYASADEVLDILSGGLSDVEYNSKLPRWVRQHAERLQEVIQNVRDEAPGFVDRAKSNFGHTVALALWLDSFETGKPGEKKKGSGEEEDGEYDEAPDGSGDASAAQWGDMTIETPPLSVVHPVARSQRTTPSVAGTHPKHWSRLPTGQVFGRRTKRGVPDAVLIDQSGSMHWDVDQLNELVSKMPVGIIATYSGDSGTGVLRVIAKDGRMVAPKWVEPYSGGNEVDGPALEWLARQPGRKVWVSDQGVCSDACDDNAALMADCQRTIDRASIKVCLSTDPKEIMRVLRQPT